MSVSFSLLIVIVCNISEMENYLVSYNIICSVKDRDSVFNRKMVFYDNGE